MQKNCTAQILHPRTVVVIEDDHNVIKRIVPPHAFRARRIGQTHRAVVVAVPGCITPPIAGLDVPNSQTREGPPNAIRPIENTQQPIPASGCRTITLPFANGDAGPAERTNHPDTPAFSIPMPRTTVQDSENDVRHPPANLRAHRRSTPERQARHTMPPGAKVLASASKIEHLAGSIK